jgi:hemerythrin superfamily protein
MVLALMPPMSGEPETIRAHFLADHQRLEVVFERVLAAFADDDREAVAAEWTQFDSALLSHMDAEERTLIPRLFRVDPRSARALLHEHAHIRSRLAELAAGVDLHMVRQEMARAFIEALRAHARSEERLLYRWADAYLDEPAKETALDALLGRRANEVTQPDAAGPRHEPRKGSIAASNSSTDTGLVKYR